MSIATSNSDKLSKLPVQLQAIEKEHLNITSASLTRARTEVVMIASDYRKSRFNLGRVLHAYKAHFKAERGWTVAAQAIGDAIDRDERTVYRIIDDYERASRVAPILLEAMVDEKIDPAAPKNAKLVEKLIQMPAPSSRKEATAVVKRAHKGIEARKKEERAVKQPVAQSLDNFTAEIVRKFERRYKNVARDKKLESEVRYVLEQIVNDLDVNIRDLRRFKRLDQIPRPLFRVVA